MPSSMPSKTPYLVTIVGMTVIGVAGVLVIFAMRPEQDNSVLIVSLLAFVAPTTTALLAYLKAEETHKVVNSRMTEFKDLLESEARLAAVLAHKEGIKEGLAEGVAMADARTDKLAAINGGAKESA